MRQILRLLRFLKFCREFIQVLHLTLYAGKIVSLSLEGEEVRIFQQDVGLNPPGNFVISFRFGAPHTFLVFMVT
jgi:hypothetical protein